LAKAANSSWEVVVTVEVLFGEEGKEEPYVKWKSRSSKESELLFARESIVEV
jgi:hypothetical protein